MRTRLIAPLAVLFLVLAGAATAAAATGVFEKNDSGVDSARDLAERGTGVTDAHRRDHADHAEHLAARDVAAPDHVLTAPTHSPWARRRPSPRATRAA